MRKTLALIMAVAVILTFVPQTVFAAAYESRTVAIEYDNIKLNIDGKIVTLTDLEGRAIEPLLLFSTMYVPMSPVVRQFGKNSVYDSKNNTLCHNISLL